MLLYLPLVIHSSEYPRISRLRWLPPCEPFSLRRCRARAPCRGARWVPVACRSQSPGNILQSAFICAGFSANFAAGALHTLMNQHFINWLHCSPERVCWRLPALPFVLVMSGPPSNRSSHPSAVHHPLLHLPSFTSGASLASSSSACRRWCVLHVARAVDI